LLRDQPLPWRAARAWRLPGVALSSRAAALGGAVAAGALAFAFYVRTLAPTVMWYDMGEFAVASETLGIAHNTGYPGLVLLGKLFTFLPAGDAAYRVNLLSAVATAVAIAVVFGIIHDLTRDPLAAACGALTLAFASTVWANATWASSYGLNLLLTAVVVRLMFAWYDERRPSTLIWAAFAFGLGLCNHRLIVVVAAPSALLLAVSWRALEGRTLLLAAGAFLAGLAPYLYLPIRGEQEPALSWARPAEWQTYLSMFLNGQTPSENWSISHAPGRLDILLAYPSYDLTWAGLLLAAVGAALLAGRRRPLAAFCVLFLALNAALVLTYSIHNVYNYLTPAYIIGAVLIGVGCAHVLALLRERGAASRTSRSLILPALAGVLMLLLPAALVMRNVERVDRSEDYAAYDFARTTLDRLPPRAVVMTDSWTAPPLWYLQLVEGQRSDVFVTPIFASPGEDAVAFAREQRAAGRPVYAADGLRSIEALEQAFTLQPVLLNGIVAPVVSSLPRPEYRDDLIPRGSLYRVLDRPPDVAVTSVPDAGAREVAFSTGVSLVGFEAAGPVDDGEVVELTYYWRADGALDDVPAALTLFAGNGGDVAHVNGWPRWHHSRQVGEGVLDAASWQPGAIIRESYFLLVPRGTPAGVYDVRLATHEGDADPGAARTQAAASLVTVGQLVVR
jgi:hypothetical protein